jgi:hypothetical protein
MTLTLGSRPQHLEDGDLVRYMDRQLDRAGNRRAELHLTACAECAARLDNMQGRSKSVSAWLGDLDVPTPDDEKRALAMAAVERARFRARSHAWGGRPALAAAAMVAMMLTVAFGTPPGRAWVSGAMERLGGVFPGEAPQEQGSPPPMQAIEVSPSAAPSAEEAEPAATPTVAPNRARRPVLPPGMSEAVPFNPTGNYVLLKFDSRQRIGSATIWVKDIPGASGQVVAGRQSETLVPTSDGLQVRNAGGSRADYTVEIPTRYRFIRVQIGDEPETVIEVSRARRDWLWTVSLTDSGS